MFGQNNRYDKGTERKAGSVPGSQERPERSRTAFKGVLWSFAERLSTQFATFIITIILARILTPSDFGLIGMLLIFVEVGEALATGGLTEALIKRGFKNPSDCVSVMLFNGIVGLIIYSVVYFAAPLIAELYSIPQLTVLAQSLAILIPLRALTCVGIARLTYQMDFRTQAIVTLAAILLSGTLAIITASNDAGAWALVVFQVGRALFLLIGIGIITGYVNILRSVRMLDLPGMKDLLKFGVGMTGARLADIAYNNSYLMAIGLMMPPADVGFFTRARQFSSVPSISIGEVVRRVTYPLLCRYNDSLDDISGDVHIERKNGEKFIRLQRLVMFIGVPVMLTLAALSEPVVGLVLGEKWLPAAPLMSLLCLGAVWIPFDSLNLALLPAGGRPGGLFRIELTRKAIGLLALAATLNFGLIWICAGYAIAGLVSAVITACYAGRRIHAGASRQFLGIALILIFGLCASFAGHNCSHFGDTYLLNLLSGTAASATVYLLLAWLFRLPELSWLANKLKNGHSDSGGQKSPCEPRDEEKGFYGQKDDEKRIKVLHVYPQMNCGGLERVIADIVTHTDPDRFEHEILVQRSGSMDESFKKAGIIIHEIHFDGNVKRYRESLKAFFGENHYDAVHCHSHREMSVVNGSARKAGIPVRIAHCHNAHQDVGGIKSWLRILRFYHHRKGATVLLGCSGAALRWMFPFPGVRGCVIENGIDPGEWRFSQEKREEIRAEISEKTGLCLSEHDKIVLNVGRLCDQKDQHFILDIAHEIKHREISRQVIRTSEDVPENEHGSGIKRGRIIFVLVGDGPIREDLYKRKKEEGLENVVFVGERDDVDRWICGADVFLFPSRFEGQGIAALEAQASGLPVIGSEILPEEADCGIGLLRKVKGRNLADWIEAIEKQNVSPEERMGGTVPDFRFSLSAIIPRYEKLYEESRSTGKIFFCREFESKVVTGGNSYDKLMREFLDELYPGSVMELYARRDREGLAVQKSLAPLNALKTGMSLYARHSDPSARLKKRVWMFNTSKCLYFLPLLFFLRAKGERTVGVTHHPLWMQMKGLQRRIYKVAEETMIRLLDIRIAPSPFMYDYLSSEKFMRQGAVTELLEIPFKNSICDKNTLKIENNSQILHKFAYKTDSADPYLIYVATIEPRKGLHYLLEAMSDLNRKGIEIGLRVMGNIVDRNYGLKCKRYISERNLKVEWLGFMTGEAKNRQISGASALVLPSEAEGYGIVLVEAMALRTPVAAFRNTGMISVIGAQNERGLLADDRDPVSLSKAITRILSDPELRQEKIESGWRYACSRPTDEDFKKNLNLICGNILR